MDNAPLYRYIFFVILFFQKKISVIRVIPVILRGFWAIQKRQNAIHELSTRGAGGTFWTGLGKSVWNLA